MHQKPWNILLTQIAGLMFRVSDSIDLRLSLRICTSNKLPVGVDDVGQRTTYWESPVYSRLWKELNISVKEFRFYQMKCVCVCVCVCVCMLSKFLTRITLHLKKYTVDSIKGNLLFTLLPSPQVLLPKSHTFLVPCVSFYDYRIQGSTVFSIQVHRMLIFLS